MSTHSKKRIYQSAVIAVSAEAIIALSLIFIPGPTVFEKLKIFGGLFIIIKSVFFIFLVNDRLVNEILLKVSLFFIWIIPSFLAGLALLLSVWLSIPVNPTPDSKVIRPRVPLQSDPSANWVAERWAEATIS
jgi:hypothetical protein